MIASLAWLILEERNSRGTVHDSVLDVPEPYSSAQSENDWADCQLPQVQFDAPDHGASDREAPGRDAREAPEQRTTADTRRVASRSYRLERDD